MPCHGLGIGAVILQLYALLGTPGTVPKLLVSAFGGHTYSANDLTVAVATRHGKTFLQPAMARTTVQ